ncbi:MAG: helix-turn-helix transcriptional regulator [Acaryochloris sp. SU_5_25]|nr:helix-turn-helix transcriptional regulator [Acaryochloris sp. SU_5_25]
MTIQITGEALDELFAEGLERGEIVDEWNGVEGRNEMLPQFGYGGGSSLELRNGLWLELEDYTWRNDMVIDFHHDECECLTAKFYVSGCVRTVTPHVPGVSEDYLEVSGQNSLFFLPDLQEWEHSPADQRQQIVKVGLEPEFFRTFSTGFDALPSALRPLAEGCLTERLYQHLGTMTPAMRRVLRDILGCPYAGVMRQIYLEGKALELVVLQLAHWLEVDQKSLRPNGLQTKEIERLHQAKEILTRDFMHPPSLLDLARQVKLNDYKLKRGFRELFGTTVWQYLQQQRMAQAKHLLSETNMTMIEMTHAVGYQSQSHFSHMFKRQFGITPREYRNGL